MKRLTCCIGAALGMGGGAGKSAPVIVPGSVEVGASVQMIFAYQEAQS